MPSRLLKSALLLFSLTLAGCGFHLQNSYRLPQDLYTLHLEADDRYAELTRVVRERLRQQDVTVIDQGEPQLATLKLTGDNLKRQTLSLFENAQTAEYLLVYNVDFQLQRPGKPIYKFSFEISRDYQDNPNRSLAKSREVDLLLTEMRTEAADYIVRQLSRTDTL